MDDAHEGPVERQLAPQVAVDEDKAGVVRPGGSLAELLQQVVDDARRLLEVDVAIVYLAEPTEDPAHWTYDSGLSPQAHEDSWRQPIDLHGGMTGLALSTGRVIVTQDYANDDRFWDPERRRLNAEHLGTTSVVSVPMYGAAGPLGAFCVFDRRHRGFSEFELALLRALAAHAAVAIENARLGRVLAAAEARYRFLVERSPDAIWSIDAKGAFTFVNATSEQLTGWTAEELIGRDSEMVHHESTDEEIHRQLALQREHPEQEILFRCNLRHRDGHAVPVEIHTIGLVADGGWAGALGTVRDTGRRDRMERELRAQATELAANRERTHLAQDLHDSVTQALFSMTLTTRAAEMLLQRDPAATAEKLGELRELAQDALAEMRTLIFELRPGSLAEEGLVSALRKHVAAVQGRTGLPVVFEADEILSVGPELEEALYRICQEALHNVVKHAAARQVQIELRRDGGCVSVVVTDDGTGFDPTTASRGGHLGLAGIRARVERFGGRLTIESAPGSGTRLEISVPAKAETPGE
jgi:PAS domain S-box-containing protein